MSKEKQLTPTQQSLQMMEAAKAFETSRIDLIKQSNKRAWIISGVCLAVTVTAISAVALLTPLKTVEPYVIRVDNNTGQTDIVYALKEQQISKDEQMDRYWLKNYVTFRESYDWFTVQSNYDATMMLSGEKEQRQLAEFFNSDAAPYKIMKNDLRADVKITSISYVGDLAQVRFERRVRDLRDTREEPIVQKLIATIAYQYVNTKVSQEERLINPLGFKVESYKTDIEH